jgi:hypothetical protein
MNHNVAAGMIGPFHVAVCICGWRNESADLDAAALAIGNHIVADDPGPSAPQILNVVADVLDAARIAGTLSDLAATATLIVEALERYGYLAPAGYAAGVQAMYDAITATGADFLADALAEVKETHPAIFNEG